MNILFYVNPLIVRSNPNFFSGAVEKKLIKQAKLLGQAGARITFLVGEFDEPVIRHYYPSVDVVSISQREIVSAVGTSANIEVELYRNEEGARSANFVELIISKVAFDPQVIFCWETPANFFRKFYPTATVIHQMPGFLSRVPFPEFYTLDTHGLFRESAVVVRQQEILKFAGEPRANSLIQAIRKELVSFIDNHTPFSRSDLDPEGKYERLILLPLQVTDQYAFKVDSGYESQMALLIDVLTQLDERTGLVVTQYTAGGSKDAVLNMEVHAQLAEKYPNLIYDVMFDRIDNVSQYILPCVDAVITVSSSVGIQALLWKKPLIVIGNSHLKSAAFYHSLLEFFNEAEINHYSSENDRYLEWIFTYQQPLATLILNDVQFLMSWLNEAQTTHTNHIEHSLPNIFDLVDGYEEKVINAVRKDRAFDLLSSTFEVSKGKLEAKFESSFFKLNPKVVSFDIFDTLLDRVAEQPRHLFKVMECEVEGITNGLLSNFSSIRPIVERDVREKSLAIGKSQEITLDEIYAEIGRKYALTEAMILAIRNVELSLERRSLQRRNAGWRIYQYALKKNVRVIAISDMYLPKDFICECLTSAGYTDIDAIYISSSIGLRKHEGQLFEWVQKEEKIAWNEWLHVGDNPHGDEAIPRSYGIESFLLKSAFQNVSGNKKFGSLIQSDKKNRSLAESAIYGAIQRRFFDDPYVNYHVDTHFNSQEFNLGYIGAGPMFFGFIHWIMQSAKEDQIDLVLFLSRDGKILWQMASILFPVSEGWPRTDYVFSSRRAARVASIFNVGDISKLVDSSLAAGTLQNMFVGKFGVELLENDLSLINKWGFKNGDSLVNPAKDRENIRGLAMEISKRILKNAEEEREHLSAYYKRKGLDEGLKVAVVDIGYAATMQVAMSKITGNKSVNGYYYITFESALENLGKTGFIKGYAGNFVKPHLHPDMICRNGFLFETIFCSSDCSFIAFAKSRDGRIVPRFDLRTNSALRKKLIGKVHSGALALARDLRTFYVSNIGQLTIDSVSASRILSNFIMQPGGRDAELFEGVQFDDAFAGSSNRYIVPPREIILRDPKIVFQSIWQEGAKVFSRRPDINKSSVAHAHQEKTEKRIGIHVKIIKKLEKLFVGMFAGKRKKEKYLKNRDLFFIDAKGFFIQLYWNNLGKKIIR